MASAIRRVFKREAGNKNYKTEISYTMWTERLERHKVTKLYGQKVKNNVERQKRQ